MPYTHPLLDRECVHPLYGHVLTLRCNVCKLYSTVAYAICTGFLGTGPRVNICMDAMCDWFSRLWLPYRYTLSPLLNVLK